LQSSFVDFSQAKLHVPTRLFLPAVEAQQKTTTRANVKVPAKPSASRKSASRKKKPLAQKHTSRTNHTQAEKMPPSDVSICSTDSEVSSLGGGDSDTDHPSNYLLNMGFDEFADEASINSTAFYPVAAIPSLEMDKGQPGRLETVADDLHSWLDVLMAEESFL